MNREQKIWERIAVWVAKNGSRRFNCKSEPGAAELAVLVCEEFRNLGLEMHYDAWVFGKAVHVFPVYYRCKGSLADLEVQERRERGRHGYR